MIKYRLMALKESICVATNRESTDSLRKRIKLELHSATFEVAAIFFFPVTSAFLLTNDRLRFIEMASVPCDVHTCFAYRWKEEDFSFLSIFALYGFK